MHGTHAPVSPNGRGCRHEKGHCNLSLKEFITIPLMVALEEVEQMLEVGSHWVSFLAHLGGFIYLYCRGATLGPVRNFTSDLFGIHGFALTFWAYFVFKNAYILFKTAVRNTHLYHSQQFLGETGEFLLVSDVIALVAGCLNLLTEAAESDNLGNIGVIAAKPPLAKAILASFIIIPLLRILYSLCFRLQEEWLSFYNSKGASRHAQLSSIVTLLWDQLNDILPFFLARYRIISWDRVLGIMVITELTEEFVELAVAAWKIYRSDNPSGVNNITADISTLIERGATVAACSALLGVIHVMRAETLLAMAAETPYLTLALKSYYSTIKLAILAVISPFRAQLKDLFLFTT